MSEQERRYFGTDGIRGRANAGSLAPGFVVRLGQAAAETFLERREESERLAEEVRYIELSGRSDFNDAYMMSMMFPES